MSSSIPCGILRIRAVSSTEDQQEDRVLGNDTKRRFRPYKVLH